MKLTLEEAKRLMAENNGDLDLRGTGFTKLPDNLTVEGYLDLQETGITELPNGLTVEGWLGLDGTEIAELPDNLSVGGGLGLKGTKIKDIPNNLIVGGWLDLSYTKITELPDDLIVGSGLDLCGTKIVELPDNLTVGDWLDLSSTKITKLPDRLTVGDGLDLTGTGITKLPGSLKVGSRIYDRNGKIIQDEKYRLREGDYVPGRYLYADGILTHVKRKKKVGPYDYYIGKIPGRNVISDGTYYVHCRNLREGIHDFDFKLAEYRVVDQYRGLTLDSVLPTGEMITMYRVITGACRQGTECFLKSLGSLKDSYSVRETVELTQGQYGSETFREFFS